MSSAVKRNSGRSWTYNRVTFLCICEFVQGPRSRRSTTMYADADPFSIQRMLNEPVNVMAPRRRVCPKPLGQQISETVNNFTDAVSSAWREAEQSNKEYWTQKAEELSSQSGSADPSVAVTTGKQADLPKGLEPSPISPSVPKVQPYTQTTQQSEAMPKTESTPPANPPASPQPAPTQQPMDQLPQVKQDVPPPPKQDMLPQTRLEMPTAKKPDLPVPDAVEPAGGVFSLPPLPTLFPSHLMPSLPA